MYTKIFKFAASIGVCQLAGIIGSIFTASTVSSWYPTLIKPNFSPPSWLFAPVWVLLYFLMGISLYLIWQNRAKDNKKSLIVFDILLILAAIILTIVFSFKISSYAAILLVPYLVWMSFATILNYSIMSLNYS